MKNQPYCSYTEDDEDNLIDEKILSVLKSYELDILESLFENSSLEENEPLEEDINNLFNNNSNEKSALQRIELLREKKEIQQAINDFGN